MDTTTIIILLAIVVIIVLRLAVRSYRSRQTGNRGYREEHLVPPNSRAEANVDSTPPFVEKPGEQPPQKHLEEINASPVLVEPMMADPGVTNTIGASSLCKSFGGRQVVNNVSFEVKRGEIFGLVGPNGAGKTTTIRMLMDVIKPDSGEITLFGRPIDEETKNRVGYLPEERGLYRRMTVSDTIVYLASLKNVNTGDAKKRATVLLDRVDMLLHQRKKTSELSRGMAQIIQFVVTIAHNPDLIILDEPFSGLDPINRRLLKDLILELREQGRTIILSTHMMNEIEEMCDRILMIDQGRVVLYGNLAEIKWRYRNNSVLVEHDGEIGELLGIRRKRVHGKQAELFLDGQTHPQQILKQLIDKKVQVNRFEVSTPSLNDIFIQVVESRR